VLLLQDNNLQEFLARVGGGDAEDDDQFSHESSTNTNKRQRQHSIEDAGEEDQLMSAMGVLVVCRYEKLPIEQQSVLRCVVCVFCCSYYNAAVDTVVAAASSAETVSSVQCEKASLHKKYSASLLRAVCVQLTLQY
jgi:hypothetical protein